MLVNDLIKIIYYLVVVILQKLNRTKNTIKYVAPNLGFKSFVELNEWNFGSAESVPAIKHEHIKFPFGNYFVELGGENQQQVRSRTKFIMNKIAEEDFNENILVVSHGRILREFSGLHLLNSKVERPKNMFNCIVFKFEYETTNKTWKFVEIIKTDTN
ncbi:phosphoglycerate mutase [Mesoplasma corruscae]|uniref:Phosphoglycerate mutase n=1 Tax=Mesoplasma corruscae TaxID=216874 RepID=A0A2S5RFV2_9MOLU|nr:phosphoglycerate mutase [Mesoplasma corruscae]